MARRPFDPELEAILAGDSDEDGVELKVPGIADIDKLLKPLVAAQSASAVRGAIRGLLPKPLTEVGMFVSLELSAMTIEKAVDFAPRATKAHLLFTLAEQLKRIKGLAGADTGNSEWNAVIRKFSTRLDALVDRSTTRIIEKVTADAKDDAVAFLSDLAFIAADDHGGHSYNSDTVVVAMKKLESSISSRSDESGYTPCFGGGNSE